MPSLARRERSANSFSSSREALTTPAVNLQTSRQERTTKAMAESTFKQAGVSLPRSAMSIARRRIWSPRSRWWLAGLLASVAGLSLLGASPAGAAQTGVVQISADPYTSASASNGEHATEVEPDTFAWGSSVVTEFHTGRIFNA